jgi:probable O-glycosylation ligase (exosortase A-associated)
VKQTLFMAFLTLFGGLGSFVVGPFLGFAVYILFAVLRPQFIWEWSLPENVSWSLYVALPTLLALAAMGPRAPRPQIGKLPPSPIALNTAHLLFLLFGVWIVVAFLVGNKTDAGEAYIELYFKIFVMYWAGWLIVRTANQVWILVLIYALSLGYIAYEVNFMYFTWGTLKIGREGYGGYDNNGAGLLLAMGVPFCAFAWEAYRGWYRWPFAILIPVIIHAVMMTYSRGAMVSMLLASPWWILRGRYRKQKFLLGCVVASMIPFLAGKEIQERFFSIQKSETDESAQSRFASWDAGIKIAMSSPISGVGLRYSNKLTKLYGADMEGRTIHNQYIQLAADTGFVGSGLYIALMVAVLWNCQRVSVGARGKPDRESELVYLSACGLQASLLTFFIGATFLSCEAFEPQYFLLFIAAQLPLIRPPGAKVLGVPAAAPAQTAAPRPPEQAPARHLVGGRS